ncbi:MAG TPA: class I SAM-dependent methyltransferase [Chloroflexota bacterium]|nr:class I SAM-dependent methyltransferase [Chloroflexota bacterium]
MGSESARAWDREYEAGRYDAEPPEPFLDDILAAARQAGITSGLYIGCGNGRNYVPLVRAGLNVVGLDISPIALAQLAERVPERRDSLICGDLGALPRDACYDLVLGIQVFQHGDRATAHAHIRSAVDRVAPDGLFAIRVNAAQTDVWPAHTITERGADDGFSVRYREGAKSGLDIHFFARAELESLLAGLRPVLPLRLRSTRRQPPAPGQWSQWEGIWQK